LRQGPFGLGLRWLGRYSPFQGCADLAALPQAKIPPAIRKLILATGLECWLRANRGVRPHLFVAVEKRRSPKDYASQIQTQTAKSAGPQTRSAEALARAIQSPPTETPRHDHEKRIMNIQINTDNHITGREALAQQAEANVTSALGHLAEHITRVEVHLSDENGNKTGVRDKRCMMEARLEGHQPIAVTDESESLNDAIAGAADKLKRSLDHTLSRLNPR
jgi:ribosome-associated translation inhibitor RaiA